MTTYQVLAELKTKKDILGSIPDHKARRFLPITPFLIHSGYNVIAYDNTPRTIETMDSYGSLYFRGREQNKGQVLAVEFTYDQMGEHPIKSETILANISALDYLKKIKIARPFRGASDTLREIEGKYHLLKEMITNDNFRELYHRMFGEVRGIDDLILELEVAKLGPAQLTQYLAGSSS